jgi:hypothetical protein
MFCVATEKVGGQKLARTMRDLAGLS